jgi:DNA ligase-1
MASDKRDFVNFEEFPGGINGDKNLYEMPSLYKTASTGKAREWTIYCRLIKSDSKDQELTKKQNWNLMAENEVVLKDEWVQNKAKIPEGIIAEVWSESGLVTGMMSRSAATYIEVPKNINKKNERNVLQQALVTMRSKYLKKIDDGSITELVNLSNDLVLTNNTKFYPMLAKKYEDFKGKITYPMYVQPKLDGNRCIAFLDKIINPTYVNVIMYTRSHKEYDNNEVNINIKKALLPILVNGYDRAHDCSIYFDGELYIHNQSLQKINSEIRNTKDKSTIPLQYHIYDHFYPWYESEGFAFRNKKLDFILKNLSPDSLVKHVKAELVNNEIENEQYYKDCLKQNYEGSMIRSVDGPYLKSATKKSEQLRSKDLLKYKPTYDDEYEVIGFKEGDNGKEIGAVIWICKTPDGHEFSVTPNMPYKERYDIYKECISIFDSKYKNRMMTVEYGGLSDAVIPLRLKAIGFRDYL